MTSAGRRAVTALVATGGLLLSATACTSSGSDGSSASPSVPDGTLTGSANPPQTTSAATGSPSGTATRNLPTRAPTATVPSGTVTTRPPVPISSPVDAGRGVTARIYSVRSVNAQAKLPGEIGGPAVLVAIRLQNGSSRAVALEPVVNLYYGATRTPASTISGPPTKPFNSRLAAGRSATGSYTFTLDASQRGNVRVEFSYAPTAAVVLWQGSVS